MSHIKLSVALVTRNRPQSLDRCLRSLRSQSLQPFEVVVSDDSDSGLAPEVEIIASRWNCRYIQGPRRGLYANRNNAALACRGTHIRTLDDDHEFPDGHFEIVSVAVESDPDCIWILGERPGSLKVSSVTGLPGELQPRGFVQAALNYNDCFAISDGASVYPRQVFEKHRFLEAFEFGHLYSEFGARLKALGYRMRLCAETYIIHHYDEATRSFGDKGIEQKSSFLASYLTYSCYFPSYLKSAECLGWFLGLALSSSLKLGNHSFYISDFWRTWQLARKYRALFNSARYEQVI